MDANHSNPDLGDIQARHQVRPLTVASLNAPDPTGGSDHVPFAMVLTLDVAEVPGLQGVLDRVAAGENLDVISRWAGAVDEEGSLPPYAMVDFYLPECQVGVQVFVDVDKHPRALQAGVRTGRVFILSPEQNERLQHEENIQKWIRDVRPFGVEPPDPTPIVGLLHQRFDLPRPVYEPAKRVIGDQVGLDDAAEFFAGARLISRAVVWVRGDGPVTIALVDPDSGSLRDQIPEGAKVEGRWGALAYGDRVVVAFDAAVDGKLIGRWVMADPPQELILAGSHGEHGVGILTAFSQDDQEEADRQWKEGIHAWVTHVEAFRSLRFHAARSSSE